MKNNTEFSKPSPVFDAIKILEEKPISSRRETNEVLNSLLSKIVVRDSDIDKLAIISEDSPNKSHSGLASYISSKRIEVKKFCLQLLTNLEQCPTFSTNAEEQTLSPRSRLDSPLSQRLQTSRGGDILLSPMKPINKEQFQLTKDSFNSNATQPNEGRIKNIDTYDNQSSSQINTLIFLDQTEYILSGNNEGFVNLWNLKKHEPISKFSLDSPVTAITALPDEQTILIGTKMGVISAYSLDNPKKPKYEIFEHKGCVNALLYISDVDVILSAGEDKHIHYWDPVTGSSKGKIRDAHKAWIWNMISMGIDRQEKDCLFATTSGDLTIKIRYAAKKVVLHTFEMDTNFCISLEYFPETKTLLAGDIVGMIYVFDISGMKIKDSFRAHSGMITAIKRLKELNYYVTCGEDKYLRVWKPNQNTPMDEVPAHHAKISSLAVLSKTIVGTNAWDKKLKFWNLEDVLF